MKGKLGLVSVVVFLSMASCFAEEAPTGNEVAAEQSQSGGVETEKGIAMPSDHVKAEAEAPNNKSETNETNQVKVDNDNTVDDTATADDDY